MTATTDDAWTDLPRDGERCSCGDQAVWVYVTTRHGRVPYCGVPHRRDDQEDRQDHDR